MTITVAQAKVASEDVVAAEVKEAAPSQSMATAPDAAERPETSQSLAHPKRVKKEVAECPKTPADWCPRCWYASRGRKI